MRLLPGVVKCRRNGATIRATLCFPAIFMTLVRLVTACPLIFLSTFLFAQKSTVPYAEFAEPTIEDTAVRYTYPDSYPSIRAVNFRNRQLQVLGQAVRLRNGESKWVEKGLSHNEVSLDEIFYLTQPNASGTQYALLIFTWFSAGGSSSQEGIAQVVELSDHRLQTIQELQWDQHFDTSHYESFNPRTKTLTVRSAHYMPGDAHCCVSAMDVYTLQWNGSKFIQKSMTTELSDYGKREGKKLGS